MANNIQYGYGGQGQTLNYGYQQSYNGPYNMQQTGQPSQSYTQQYGQSYGSPAPNNRAWADDEYEARSIRVPDGWPADTPLAICMCASVSVRNVSSQEIQLQNANMTIVFDGVHQ